MSTMPDIVREGDHESGATFSPDRQYRYSLRRHWAGGPVVAFIGLNPSTADAQRNDPTVRRCINFAHAWGYGTMFMLNIFAYRSTQVADMKAQDLPIGGPDNDSALRTLTQGALTIACWGTHGAYRGRGDRVREMLAADGRKLHYLRLTKHGFPQHPLYLPRTLLPTEWPAWM